ncbi:GNAT family N-acetyltransferase [Deinococcus radiotolerans]|uniref:GNAT family N-acetyltransferase n=1 Tax=Deinococcus radiotolerans TaxID=1309407 RepID=A0ABQ2FPF2_9DEIO|nr:GNAT family N-acetyltransferase [Deinococcus radiotolerans]GGL13890.1 GNAT family N-acetyltransferase [Deinococcus radiotolerans]
MTYITESPTLDTLPDIYALHADLAERNRLLSVLRENLAAGRNRLENLLILRSDRGIEGTALVSPAVQVPYFPRLRPDVTEEAMTLLARTLRDRAESERRLILQNDLAPLHREAVEAAGWQYSSTEVAYDTDLTARTYALDPRAQEGDESMLLRPDVQALIHALGSQLQQFSGGFRDGWTVVALPGDEVGEPLLALGAYGPAKPGYGGVDMIGVHPQARGQGLGTRLNAHLLARLAERFTQHGGLTSADNHAMRRILQKNGSRHTATQMYFQ